jgi:FkbM family methyltransferase
MNLPKKISTVARLVSRGQWDLLRRQWRINIARARLRRQGVNAFRHGDLGFPSVCHPDWPDSVDQFLNCAGDQWEYSLLAEWLQQGDVCFDLGANVGLYSCAALDAVGQTGRVVAVDADPFVCEKLKATAAVLGTDRLLVVHAAVAPEDGQLTFHVQSDRTITGEQSLRPTPAQLATSTPISVPARRLQSLADLNPAANPPGLVKVDIEGAEVGALASAPVPWLGPAGPLWIVEINPGALARFGTQPADITRYFPSENFQCWLVVKHPYPSHTGAQLRPLAPDEKFTDSMYYNMIAIPQGDRWRGHRTQLARYFEGTST